MTYLHCTTCGKEKVKGSRLPGRCKSCAMKGKKQPPASEETREKMSASHKDKTQSIEARRAMSIARGGDGDVENRRYPGIGRWRRLVIQRDGKCMTCGSTEHLEAHHIFQKAMYPDLAAKLANGKTLCASCHREGPNAVHKKKKGNKQ